jgi:mRNA interferase MazF
VVELARGDLIQVAPEVAIGREQAGRRPALVIAGPGYLAAVESLAIVIPLTSVDRGWPNHVKVRGGQLPAPSWAMTEQLRTISRERTVGRLGRATPETVAEALQWVRDFLEL